MSSITLSAGVRNNLLSLQGTANLLNQTQERLATGLKVNSALDDASAFFTSRGLSARANDLSSITQGMGNAMKTVDAASKGLDAITKNVEGMTGLLRQARQDASESVGQSAAIELDAVDWNATAVNGSITFEIFSEGAAASANTNKIGEVTVNADLRDATLGTSGTNLEQSETRTRALAEAINNDTGASAQGIRAVAQLNGNGDAFELVIENATGNYISVDAANNSFGGAINDGASTPNRVGPGGDLSDVRQSLMNSYNELRTELEQLAKDSGFNGVNLLNGDSLDVIFNELTGANRSELTVRANQANGNAFGAIDAARLGAAEGTATMFGSNANIDNQIQSLQGAMTDLRSLSSQLGTQQTILENRETFTKNMVNTLQAGADSLVLADMNEEAANSLALQTKQQLGQSALGLATRSDQAVLQLLR
ncbi:MAG: hypothetical protein JJU40_16445 [Rhodobacteraceae bacterium]|nr:hypothetical protein [Paracoccaceae bacterium]